MPDEAMIQDESPADFLSGIGTALASTDNVDSDLAEILTRHLLQLPQHTDVVASARREIAGLALQRAKARD